MNEELEMILEKNKLLQQKMANLSNETYQDVMDFLVSSDFFDNPEMVDQFIDTYLIFAEVRPLLIQLLINMIKDLFIKHFWLKDKFFKILYHTFFTSLAVKDSSVILHILYHLMKLEVYSSQQIVEEFKKYFNFKFIGSQILSIRQFFFFFAFELYESGVNYFKRVQYFIESIYRGSKFMETLKNYFENNFELLLAARESFHFGEPILKVLIEDDVNTFMQIVPVPDFDINMKYKINRFSIFSTVADVPLIGTAVALGAVKCFKFLLSMNANIDFCTIDCGSLAQSAILNGNIEIIRLLQQYDVSFKGTLPTCVRYFQSELFYWLHEQYFPDLEEVSQTNSTVLCHACQNANYEILHYCIKEGINLNASDGDSTPLDTASYHGHLLAVKVLCSFSSVDVNLNAPFHQAIIGNKNEVVDYLMTLSNVNFLAVATQDSNENICIAIATSNIYLVEKFLKNHVFKDQYLNDWNLIGNMLYIGIRANNAKMFDIVYKALMESTYKKEIIEEIEERMHTIVKYDCDKILRIIPNYVNLYSQTKKKMLLDAVDNYIINIAECLLEDQEMMEYFKNSCDFDELKRNNIIYILKSFDTNLYFE